MYLCLPHCPMVRTEEVIIIGHDGFWVGVGGGKAARYVTFLASWDKAALHFTSLSPPTYKHSRGRTAIISLS